MIHPVTLPGSIEAERAVLGSCLLSAEALETAISDLKPEDFCNNNNKLIFDVLTQMYSEGKPADYITLPEELLKRDILDRLGGQTYIDSLVAGVQFTGNVSYYVNIVRERSVRRKIIAAGEKISRLAFDFEMRFSRISREAIP